MNVRKRIKEILDRYPILEDDRNDLAKIIEDAFNSGGGGGGLIITPDTPSILEFEGDERVPMVNSASQLVTTTIGNIISYIVEYVSKPENIEEETIVRIVNEIVYGSPTKPEGVELAKTSDLKNKVDKVEGKQLSTEDFTTELKEKLATLANYNDDEIKAQIESLRVSLDVLINGDASDAIDTYNEIVNFLSTFKDTQTLEGIVGQIYEEITNMVNQFPTSLSQLHNDMNFLTEHQDLSHLATKKEVDEVRNGFVQIEQVSAGAIAKADEAYKKADEVTKTAETANQKADKAISDSKVAIDTIETIKNITNIDEATAAITQVILQVNKNTEDLKHRFGWCRDVEGIRQYFATEDDASLYDEDPITYSDLLIHTMKTAAEGGGGGGGSASGMSYYLRVVNNLPSRNIVASKGDPCNIEFTFVSQQKDVADEEYSDTGERGYCEVSIRTGTSTTFEVIKEYYVQSNVPQIIDVAKYLGTGTNQIKVKITGELTEQSAPAFTWTAQLTSLSISAPNFTWWNSFNSDFTIPYLIGGNVNKNLIVTVTNQTYSDEEPTYNEEYTVNIGSQPYTETAYNFTCPHPGTPGVYNVSAKIITADGAIETKAIDFNVICVSAGHVGQYIAINKVVPELINWTENVAFEYSVYNGAANASLLLTLTKDGTTAYTAKLDSVVTAARQLFTVPLEIETVDDSDFQLVLDGAVDNVVVLENVTFNVDNSHGYAAVAGMVFYFNPKTRDNLQANRDKVINEITHQEVTTTITGVNWGSDGYQIVSDGKVFRLFAGSLMTIGYKPYENEVARIGSTISLDIKIQNPLDFDNTIFKIVEQTVNNYIGVNLKPDTLVVHSAAQANDDNQILHFEDNARIRLDIVIMPNAYGTNGFNLVLLYVDGVKNREFTYSTNDYFANKGDIVIGSTSADIDTYGIRVYNKALTSTAIQRNVINWLATIDEKESYQARNDIYDSSGTKVDIEKVKQRCNVIVFEGEIPSLSNPNKFKNNWYFYWRDHPEWNCIIRKINQDGQGTSAKLYDDWNQRGKADDETITTYADGSTTEGAFIFIPGMPKVKTFTFKLNWASSCQCNKMGSVNSINELCEYLDILDADKNRVGVYQHPFVGFQLVYDEDGNPDYIFLGLLTGGPDKGDKKTMGWDYDKYPDLISVEGADNASLGAQFKVPMNPNKSYWSFNMDEESFQYNGINAWDYNAGNYETKEDIQSHFYRIFAPVYNFVYQCSPHLTYWDGTIDTLNTAENILLHKNDDTEFFTSDGNLYYYEAAENKFIPSDVGEGAINLNTQLVDKGYGLTSDMLSDKTGQQQADLYKAARILKFNLECPNYFHKKQCLFNVNWMEVNASSDTRTKNTYFTIRGLLSDGHRCTFFWDDTDTIGPFNNQGQDKKPYYCEVGDKYDNGQPVWNGEQNRFFNLVELAYPTDRYDAMFELLNAMMVLSGVKEGNASHKLYMFYHKYYFSQAQEYFPEALYNETAKVLYEDAKVKYDSGAYVNDTDPITQSLGNHYSGWKRFIKKRIQYIQSKYSFGDYSANGGDIITVRAAGNDITYNLTPAIWMYPNVATGTSIIRGERTPAGEVCNITISLGGSADQQTNIKGANYLRSIGNWWDKNVTGAMIIQGRMLREIRLGHPTEDIVISISSLTISNATSLQLLDMRRISTLSGILNLADCTHLQEVYAGGTVLSQMILPYGGPLAHIQYSSLNQYITLKNFPLLTTENVDISQCVNSITDYFVADCPSIGPMYLLSQIISAQLESGVQSLKRIRATGFNETFDNGEVLTLLAELTNGNYAGLDAEGVAGPDVPIPVLEGTIDVKANVYEEDINKLREAFPRLNIIIAGNYYVKFADPEVKRVIVNKWGDGVGITLHQVKSITTLDAIFNSNALIETFDEFELFTGVTVLNNYKGEFNNCFNLKSVIIPYSVTEFKWSFANCANLRRLIFKYPITSIPGGAFQACFRLASFDFSNIQTIGDMNNSGLSGVFDIPNLNSLSNAGANNTNYRGIRSFGSIKEIPGNFCSYWYLCNKLVIPEGIEVWEPNLGRMYNLVTVVFPSTMTTIKNSLFFLSYPKNVIFKSVTPPTLENSIQSGPTIYVPDESVETYKTATNWSSYASKIKPISEYIESGFYSAVPSVIYEDCYLDVWYDNEFAPMNYVIKSGIGATIDKYGFISFDKDLESQHFEIEGVLIDNPSKIIKLNFDYKKVNLIEIDISIYTIIKKRLSLKKESLSIQSIKDEANFDIYIIPVSAGDIYKISSNTNCDTTYYDPVAIAMKTDTLPTDETISECEVLIPTTPMLSTSLGYDCFCTIPKGHSYLCIQCRSTTHSSYMRGFPIKVFKGNNN